MKVVRLQSENVKRLVAVDITPEGALVTIGGKNGMGKSSVLDSLAYCLGGQALVPAEPIRQGETEAKIVVDLGEYVVTRKFKREWHHDAECTSRPDGKMPCNCSVEFGPTSSTLVVTNKDGAKYPSPQALLDKMLGRLTFDPENFKRLEPKPQSDLLRKLCGINTADLDEQRRTQVALRTDLNRQLKAQETLLASQPHYTDAPPQEIPVSEVTAALQQAEKLRKAAQTATSAALIAQQDVQSLQLKHDQTMARISELEKLIADARVSLGKIEDLYTPANQTWSNRKAEQAEAEAAVPDIAATQAELAEIDDTNKKVRANVARANIAAKRDQLASAAAGGDLSIQNLDAMKFAQILSAKFPVEGLGLNDNGVLWNGLPFEQASTSEQLRVSVAIGLALNPTLKVLLVRNGNALDENSMNLLAEQAAAADAQVWCEYVTGNAGDVSVMIEDGHVA